MQLKLITARIVLFKSIRNSKRRKDVTKEILRRNLIETR